VQGCYSSFGRDYSNEGEPRLCCVTAITTIDAFFVLSVFMARVLLAWELGGGLGHVVPLRVLADELAARNHRVVVALRDLSAHAALRGIVADVLQAPTAPERPKSPIDPMYTFGHLLHNCGFDDVRTLGIRVRSWLSLFDYVRPDFVVLDHSPTALLALRVAKIAKAPLGVGFSIPVDEYPLRSTRQFPPPDPDRLREDEDLVLRTINSVLEGLGAEALARIGQLYGEVNDNFLTTYAELDHYAGRKPACYWGVLVRGIGARPSWPDAMGPRIYGYLKPFAGIAALFGMLRELGSPTVIVGDGLDPGLAERFCGGNIQIEQSAVDIEAAARECDVAIVNGTHGTTANMLLAGKPVLMLPLTQEQFVTAARVEQLGAGVTVPFFDAQELRASLQAVLNLGSYRTRAEQFAARYKAWTTESQTAAIVDRIEDLVAGAPR
jgi:hypothetical protein